MSNIYRIKEQTVNDIINATKARCGITESIKMNLVADYIETIDNLKPVLVVSISGVKNYYDYGEKFDVDNLVYILKYSNGLLEKVTKDKGITVTPNRPLKLDDKYVTIEHNGYKFNVWVEVSSILVDFPEIDTSKTYVYTGEYLTPDFITMDWDNIYVDFPDSRNAGEYTIKFKPMPGRIWRWLGTDEIYSLKWTIDKAELQEVTANNLSKSYDGQEFMPEWIGYDENKMAMSGTVSPQIEYDTYSTTFALKDKLNYKWSNGYSDDLNIIWAITANQLVIPELKSEYLVIDYTGQWIDLLDINKWNYLEINKLNWEVMSFRGSIVEGSRVLEADKYAISFTPKYGYKWPDGSTGTYLAAMAQIREAIATVPTYSNSLIYNGNKQEPEWIYDSSAMQIVSTSDAIDAGNYNTIFELINPNYVWDRDDWSREKSFEWTIAKKTIESVGAVTSSLTLTYNGNYLEPTWVSYSGSEQYITKTGTAQINANQNYSTTFALSDKNNCIWSNGSTNDITFNWKINKKTVNLSVDVNDNTLTMNRNYCYIYVGNSMEGDGSLGCNVSSGSSYISIGNISYSAGRYTIPVNGKGTTTSSGILIYIYMNDTNNYHYILNLQYVTIYTSYWSPSDFANASWDTIHNVLSSATPGTLHDYFSIGDTKYITLSTSVLGTTGHYVLIIGIEHDAENTITLLTRDCLKEPDYFSSSSPLWVNGSTRSHAFLVCRDYYEANPAYPYICSVNKGFANSLTGSKSGSRTTNPSSATYYSCYCFLLSEPEVGSDKVNCIPLSINPSVYNAENTYGRTNLPYEFYENCDRTGEDSKRVKSFLGKTDGNYWFLRSRSYDTDHPDMVCTVQFYGNAGADYYDEDNNGFAPAFVVG